MSFSKDTGTFRGRSSTVKTLEDILESEEEGEVESYENETEDEKTEYVEEETEYETKANEMEIETHVETNVSPNANPIPNVPKPFHVKAKPKEEFKRGIVRESLDLSDDDDDDDDYDAEADVDEEEEEIDEYEDIEEEEVAEEDLVVDEEALHQEMLARTIDEVLLEKEELIKEYLGLVTQSNRLRLRNMYLQDYLYKLCWRKNLLFENIEKNTRSYKNRVLTKERRRKRRLDRKMMNHYKAFIEFKRRPVELSEFKVRKEDKLKREKRLRRLLKDNLRAPDFIKVINKKLVHVGDKQYYREFRSIGRNWMKIINIDTDKLKEARLHPKKSKETRIFKGIKVGLKPKPRVLIEKKGKPVYVTTKDGKVIDAEGNIVDKNKLQKNQKRETKDNGINEDCNAGKKSAETPASAWAVKVFTAPTTSTPKKHLGLKVRTQEPEIDVDDKKTRVLGERSKSRTYFFGSRSKSIHQSYTDLQKHQHHHYHRKNHRHYLKIEERLEKFKNGSFVLKMPCKPRNKKFIKLNWFNGDELIGRKSQGDAMQQSERQHVINFVEDAIHNIPYRKKAAKRKLRQEAQTNLTNWDETMEKYIKLLKDCWELQVQHKKSMEENLADWSLWEKRNEMCVDGLVVLLKSFTYQPNFSTGLARSFNKDVEEFASVLHYFHEGLMRQLIKLYKNKLSLAMVERKVKDTANPALVSNGYTAEQYSSMDQDNHAMYLKLGRIEQQLYDEKITLGRVLKRAKAMHDKRHWLKKLVIHDKVQSKSLSEATLKKANKVQTVKDTLHKELEDNWQLFFNGSLHEKPRLMNDYGMRKLFLNQNQKDRKDLRRELYLRRREHRIIQIKMLESKALLEEIQAKSSRHQTEAINDFYRKNMKSGMDRFVKLSIAHCDSKLFNYYQKSKLKKTSKALSETLDQWF